MSNGNRLLVIGGSSATGIGAAIAELAAKDDEWFDRIDVPNVMELNVQSPRSIHEYIAANGPYSHTVYAAGKASLQWIEDLLTGDDLVVGMTYAVFEEVFSINVFGFLRVLAVLKRSQLNGTILAVVSDASRTPMRGSMAYCSSKAALVMAVKVAAREMSPTWAVNGISPTVVDDTPMTEYIDSTVPEFRGWTPEAARKYERGSIPMGRRASKDEVAEVAISILRMPKFVTGSIIDVTGGK